MQKFTILCTSLILLNSCSFSVEPSKRYKVYDKIEQGDGMCDIYWFNEYKLRKNTIKCDSCYIGQPIGVNGLKL